jgi:hypothetical protein
MVQVGQEANRIVDIETSSESESTGDEPTSDGGFSWRFHTTQKMLAHPIQGRPARGAAYSYSEHFEVAGQVPYSEQKCKL